MRAPSQSIQTTSVHCNEGEHCIPTWRGAPCRSTCPMNSHIKNSKECTKPARKAKNANSTQEAVLACEAGSDRATSSPRPSWTCPTRPEKYHTQGGNDHAHHCRWTNAVALIINPIPISDTESGTAPTSHASRSPIRPLLSVVHIDIRN